MSENMTTILLSGLGGVCLGFLFFGSLLWTIRKGLVSRRPVLFFFSGYMVRMAGALFGFYWISAGQWEGLVACLVGFMLVRCAFTFSIKHLRKREERNGAQS